MARDDERIAAAEEAIRPPWSGTDRPVPRLILQPLQSFLRIEEASGILLLAAAVAALVWANSPWRAAYEALWHIELTIGLGGWSLAEDLQHWVNDGLMALFFLVVGLEIKRELLTGELREPSAAVLPAVAALGGMVVPALLYLAVNPGGEAARGWGIPVATDIAFALGVLALVGRGLPAALKSFLLALTIVDDIGRSWSSRCSTRAALHWCRSWPPVACWRSSWSCSGSRCAGRPCMCCSGWGCGWPPTPRGCMPPSPGSPSAWPPPRSRSSAPRR
jgi:hypothetical protein